MEWHSTDMENYIGYLTEESQKHHSPIVVFSPKRSDGFPLTQISVNHGELSQEEFFRRSVVIAQAREQAWEVISKRRAGDHVYINNHGYLASTTAWDKTERKFLILEAILEYIPKDNHIMDLGCATGMTGMALLLYGYKHVTFCDYDGLQLEFLRHALPAIPSFTGRWDIVPYGEEKKVDAVVALDVIEHVGKHLNFLRWVQELSRKYFVISYPFIGDFDKPYQAVIDGWVDDEVIGSVLNARHTLLVWEANHGGRLAIAQQ